MKEGIKDKKHHSTTNGNVSEPLEAIRDLKKSSLFFLMNFIYIYASVSF